ncbi:DNA modification methylase [Humisphaera borealis]|uniref:Methyltransferase n=1 Tax=Humisphaera borealis TaxID=2807512 RepID=A0A7M2WZG2_9BACT|nr:DNA modification methylase [Humisphaera borealis]QOV90907.1 DNA modification methylase [Humisphaera borealis]
MSKEAMTAKAMKPLPVHPLATILPRMSDGEFAALKDNVRTVGRIVDPIVTLDGKVLDGRHRDLICCELGIERRTVEFKSSWGSPVEYVYSKACHRHMTDSQKACAAVGVMEARVVDGKKRSAENLKKGTRKIADSGPTIGSSAVVAAGMFGVSPRYVDYARKLKKLDGKLFEETLQGRTTLPRAFRVVRRREKMTALKAKKPVLTIAGKYFLMPPGDAVARLSELPRKSARLIFADPPYNIGVDYGRGAAADKLEPKAYLEWCTDWLAEGRDVLTPDGSLWLLINDEWAAQLSMAATGLGLHLRNWIIWVESFGQNCSDKFNRTKRHLFYFVRDPKQVVFNHDAFNRQSARQVLYNDGRANPGGKLWDDVWHVNRLVEPDPERIPEFPTQLRCDPIKAIVAGCSDPDDLVVDPFNGSGTTGEAALSQERNYVGIDLSPKWLGLAGHRLGKVGHAAQSLDELERKSIQ